MATARDTPELFTTRAILASYNTSVSDLNNDIIKIISDDL